MINNRRDFLKQLSSGVGGVALAGKHRFPSQSEAGRPQEAALELSPITLESPDGRLAITFQTLNQENQTAQAGRLTYEVSFERKPVITPSALSLELAGQPPLGANVRITSAARSSIDETYRLVTGKAGIIRNHCGAVHLELEETAGSNRWMVIEARAATGAGMGSALAGFSPVRALAVPRGQKAVVVTFGGAPEPGSSVFCRWTKFEGIGSGQVVFRPREK